MTAHILTKGKTERALELYEKGVTPIAIAERLGVRPQHVHGMVQRAQQRREKAAGAQVDLEAAL